MHIKLRPSQVVVLCALSSGGAGARRAAMMAEARRARLFWKDLHTNHVDVRRICREGIHDVRRTSREGIHDGHDAPVVQGRIFLTLEDLSHEVADCKCGEMMARRWHHGGGPNAVRDYCGSLISYWMVPRLELSPLMRALKLVVRSSSPRMASGPCRALNSNAMLSPVTPWRGSVMVTARSISSRITSSPEVRCQQDGSRCFALSSISPLRTNLNLCLRDNSLYTDKGRMDSGEERSHELDRIFPEI